MFQPREPYINSILYNEHPKMMQDRLIKVGEYDSHKIKKVKAETMREMLYKAEEK